MAYEITIQDFCSIVKNPRCKGAEITNGLAKEGHENCNFCKGNYFVGGQCNYGGEHIMEKDLESINQNFQVFNVLVEKQAELVKSVNEKGFNKTKNVLLGSFENLKKGCEDNAGVGFFHTSCVGVAGSKLQFEERIKVTFKRLAKELGHYIKQVENTTWQQLHNFQQKIEELKKLSEETTQLTEDWKNESDLVKKNQLFILLSAKNKAINNLRQELKKDPKFAIFNQEKSDELDGIVKNIFQGKKNFFTWKEKDENAEAENPKQEKYFGFIPKETAKNTSLIIAGLLGTIYVYRLVKSKLEEKL